jgi:SAM-dependent methyltransferase
MLPRLILSPLRRLYYGIFSVLYRGNGVQCPVCATSFRRFVNISRQRAAPLGNVCPRCRSFERHRLVWLFLRDRTDLLLSIGKRTLLHVAPEPCLKKKFEAMTHLTYTASDLRSEDPGRRIDITAMPLLDNSVDIIICNHVLEHIPDDRKAMRELHRVLKSGGWAVINVPVDYSRDTTYEDFSLVTAVQRKINFGQADHVRVYGRDYRERLTGSGFSVKEIDYCSELGRESCRRHVLLADEMIYFCTK